MLNLHQNLNARVLIVDDNEANVQLLEIVLQTAGYTQVSSTLFPHTVCERHAQDDYDLILLDLEMPVMDGFQVMQNLQAQIGAQYLPVIAITAQPDYKLRAFEAGAKDFITKPYNILELRARMHNVLQVGLLHKQLARYRHLAEMSADLFWEQDKYGEFTLVFGAAAELISLVTAKEAQRNWALEFLIMLEGQPQLAQIDARQALVDLPVCRQLSNGALEHYRLNGEPIFDQHNHLAGYRGTGVKCAQG